MSPPGPKGEEQSAQHEGTPVSERSVCCRSERPMAVSKVPGADR